MIFRIQTDDICIEISGVGADGFARRPRDGLEGRGEMEGCQQVNYNAEGHGRRAVTPGGHDIDRERSDI